MLKMIIVEDEHRILQLIKKLVQWDALGIENAGEAENGLAALVLIQAQRPDIVITDIRMPGMDGLELVRRTQELGLDIKFIFVSGHKQFEYAQQAVRYGVAEYLVKPINKIELNNILSRLVNRCLEESGRLEKERLMENQLTRNREMLHLQFLQSLLAEPNLTILANIDECNTRYQIHFANGYFQALALQVDRLSPEVDNGNLILVAERIRDIAQDILKPQCIDLVCQTIDSQVFGLVNLERPDAIKAPIGVLFEEARKYVDRYSNLALAIGVGAVETECSSIQNSLRASIDILSARLVLGTNRIFESASLKFQFIPVKRILTGEREMEFVRLVEMLDQENLKQWMDGIFAETAALDLAHPKIYYEICAEIYRWFEETVVRLGLQEESTFNKESANLFIRAISVAELLSILETAILEKVKQYLESKRIQDAKPIRMAKQFVQDHYNEPIGLEDVAREIHYNPVYFSTLFKQEVGTNFSDYLIGFRVEKAKDLLKNTSLPLVEISEQVGYRDAKYFSKMFSKIVGINPKEYRRLYS